MRRRQGRGRVKSLASRAQRRNQNQRYMSQLVVQTRSVSKHVMLAEVLPVVGRDDDPGVLQHADVAQAAQESAELGVHSEQALIVAIGETVGYRLQLLSAPRSRSCYVTSWTSSFRRQTAQAICAIRLGVRPPLAAARRRTMTAVNWAITKPSGTARALRKDTTTNINEGSEYP